MTSITAWTTRFQDSLTRTDHEICPQAAAVRSRPRYRRSFRTWETRGPGSCSILSSRRGSSSSLAVAEATGSSKFRPALLVQRAFRWRTVDSSSPHPHRRRNAAIPWRICWPSSPMAPQPQQTCRFMTCCLMVWTLRLRHPRRQGVSTRWGVDCDLGDLSSGASTTGFVSVQIDAKATGPLVNGELATSTTFDNDQSTNFFNVTGTVIIPSAVPGIMPIGLVGMAGVLAILVACRLRRSKRRWSR